MEKRGGVWSGTIGNEQNVVVVVVVVGGDC